MRLVNPANVATVTEAGQAVLQHAERVVHDA